MINLIHTSEKIKRRNHSLAVMMDRLLERVSLDRSRLVREKVRCILGDTADDESKIRKVSEQLSVQKKERRKINKKQIDGYHKALVYMQ